MPRLAIAFSTRYPAVTLDMRVDDTEKILAALLRHDIEVAVVGREVDGLRLVGTVIERDELVPVVATADRLTKSEIVPQDLVDRPFVLREQGSATRQAVEEGLAA